MNIESLVVDDKAVLIVDDFFSKEICSDWLRYYMNSGFVLSAVENSYTEAEGESLALSIFNSLTASSTFSVPITFVSM